jgi:tetratricopeptide (TPR) repeat protein
MSRSRKAGVLAALVVVAGCRQGLRPSAGDPLAEARALVEQRQFDAALARLGSASDAESLYLIGRAWAGKAETAPLPTPPPAAEPGGAAARAPELKPEEARALEFFERAVAARPDHAAAHLAIAELLAPHALARPAPLARAGRPAPAPGREGPDVSVERVLRSYAEAVQADAAGTAAVEALIRFATSAGRVSEVDAAYRELVRRRREDPDVLVRYGDFLAATRRDPDSALAQYAQALIWRPDDVATRLKVADIHLSATADFLARREYASAEARLREARKYTTDPSSAQAARLRDIESQLREIRGR